MEVNYKQLKHEIDDLINTCTEKFYEEVPGASYQMTSKEIDKEFYECHTIQTILRIRLKRMIDALTVNWLIKNHQMREAKKWAEYLEDEMLHGNMFGKDLENMTGISMDDIYAHEPFLSTKLLNGYFYYTLEHEGPMAALASAYFLENFSRKTQPDWLDNLEEIFGKDNLKGARAHVSYDIEVDHVDFVWNVLKSTVHNPDDAHKLVEHIRVLFSLFAAYFIELHQKTGLIKDSTSVASVVIQRAGSELPATPSHGSLA